MATEKDVTDLLKSGNFTIQYHDNGYCELYSGKFDDYEDVTGKPIAEFGDKINGYIPEEVAKLIEALGGRVVTI
jgi:hypothetical protein